MIIIALLLIPAGVNVAFTSIQTRRYNQMIGRVSQSGRLTKIVSEDIPTEVYEIVAGRVRFSEGRHYAIMADVDRQIADLSAQSPDSKGSRLLIVVARAMGNLRGQLDALGQQIEADEAVDEQLKTLEQVNSSAAVITDLLSDYILLELEAAGEASQAIGVASRVTVTIEIVLTVAVCVFAFVTQGEVSRSISKPIYELETLAERIAQGDLNARAEATDVEELRSLTASLNAMAIRLQALIDANTREQQNLKKSEMRTLQAQITPHFLYNTLEAIMWLAERKRTEEVIEITKAMSNFFRIALSRGQDWISVAQEIEHVESYLVVQRFRYSDILDYRIDIDDRLGGQRILKLLLQPLVENAIYHGIKLRRGRGSIAVRGWLAGDRMCFAVEDDGIGMVEARLAEVRAQLGKEVPDGDGYGLYNVDKRLRLYYDENAGLSVESRYGAGTTVSFCVPVQEESDV